MIPSTSTLLDHNGNPIRLGNVLGRGGEGTVYELYDDPNLVAKVYHNPPPLDRASKIKAMVAGYDESLAKIAAWPNRVLVLPSGTVVGFVMPSVTAHSEVHLLHSPLSRRQHFPEKGWAFLVHVSCNIARAFSVVHAHGHVAGDVNDRNIMVAADGTVKFVDCDSFQIRSGANIFSCGLGVSTHTPPELQKRSLTNELRTPNHDSFGLAVLLFQLLFMGRHPFAGKYSGTGEMPLELAIIQTRFVYGRNASVLQMSRPPGTLALDSVTPNIATLFERAFSAEGAIHRSRPTPNEWLTALLELSMSLQVCSSNPKHQFFRGESRCPWCRIESSSSVSFFPRSSQVMPLKPSVGSIEVTWNRIQALQPPPPTGGLQVVSISGATSASSLAMSMSSQRRRVAAFTTLIVAAILILTLVFPTFSESQNVLALGAIVVGYGVFRVGTRGPRRYRNELISRKSELESKIVPLDVRYKKAGPADFQAAYDRLRPLKTEYDKLPSKQEENIRILKSTARERQLSAYLQRHRIANSSISGIGPSRTVVLASYGIESASDVSRTRVSSIPGFGDHLTHMLLMWRADLESRFVFDPAKSVSQSDIDQVKQTISVRAREIEGQMARGCVELESLRNKALIEQKAVRVAAEPDLKALAQVNVDLSELRRLVR